DAHLVDQGGRDIENVTRLDKAAQLFKNSGRIPARFGKDIVPLQGMIRSALLGVVRKPTGPTVLGDWELVERLGASDSFTEYRAVNAFAGRRGGTALLRIYQ